MKRITVLVSLLFVALIVLGAFAVVSRRQSLTLEIDGIKPNMHQNDVEAVLGKSSGSDFTSTRIPATKYSDGTLVVYRRDGSIESIEGDRLTVRGRTLAVGTPLREVRREIEWPTVETLWGGEEPPNYNFTWQPQRLSLRGFHIDGKNTTRFTLENY